MKKLICLLMTVCMLLPMAACASRGKEPTAVGVQTATNTFRLNGQATEVTVDLSGGWSVEFSTGAVYLFDGPNDGTRDAVAHGYVIDKLEYDANVEEYRGYSTFTTTADGVKFSEGEGGSSKYLFAVGNGAYFMIAVRYGAGAESVYARFDVNPGDDWSSDGGDSDGGISYLALVNKLNPLPEGWEDALETIHMTNSLGDDVEVEARAYTAYLRLKAALEAEGVRINLDSARRSVEAQQEIMDRFTAAYGKAYALKTVATPGYSEHHTGLALDLYLIIDGRNVYKNEDMMQYPEVWETIHAKLADYGFILRYPKNKEHITGYAYEPWHIRYVDSEEVARKIMSAGATLEEYLGAASSAPVDMKFGESMVYRYERLNDAAILVKCRFASFSGCELRRLYYSGDSYNQPANVQWLSGLAGTEFFQVARFESDFRTGGDAVGDLKTNTGYTDYPWWLGRTENGSWELVAWGVDPEPPAKAAS